MAKSSLPIRAELSLVLESFVLASATNLLGLRSLLITAMRLDLSQAIRHLRTELCRVVLTIRRGKAKKLVIVVCTTGLSDRKVKPRNVLSVGLLSLFNGLTLTINTSVI